MDSCFYSAVVDGDIQTAREILAKCKKLSSGVLPSFLTAPSPLGSLPIFVAARHGQVQMAEFLLDQQRSLAHQDNRGRTALMHAISQAHEELALFLVSRMSATELALTDNTGRTALDLAAHLDCSPTLVGALADKVGELEETELDLELVQPGRTKRIAKEREEQANGRCQSMCSKLSPSWRDNKQVVWSASFLYAYSGKLGLLRGLSREELLEKRGHDGVNLLIVASQGGHIPVVDFLLRTGANIESIDDFGMTALMSAAEFGHKQLVWYLLGEGANPLAVSRDGLSARDYAIENGHAHVAEALAEWNTKHISSQHAGLATDDSLSCSRRPRTPPTGKDSAHHLPPFPEEFATPVKEGAPDGSLRPWWAHKEEDTPKKQEMGCGGKAGRPLRNVVFSPEVLRKEEQEKLGDKDWSDPLSEPGAEKPAEYWTIRLRGPLTLLAQLCLSLLACLLMLTSDACPDCSTLYKTPNGSSPLNNPAAGGAESVRLHVLSSTGCDEGEERAPLMDSEQLGVSGRHGDRTSGNGDRYAAGGRAGLAQSLHVKLLLKTCGVFLFARCCHMELL